MCSCLPPCTQFEGNWPTETCPSPACTDPTPVKPVGAHDVAPGVLGLTFHCGTCPCRWYSTYELA